MSILSQCIQNADETEKELSMHPHNRAEGDQLSAISAATQYIRLKFKYASIKNSFNNIYIHVQ